MVLEKTPKAKSTPRARFEALAIGINAALKENPHLPIIDVSSWIDGEEFHNITSSDAANNRSKLIGRINFVKQKLLEGAYEIVLGYLVVFKFLDLFSLS